MIDPNALVLAVALLCPNTELIGFTGELTKQDQQFLEIAKQRCKEIYPDMPCLKVFEKKEENVYRAICGAQE